jgi:hypothetical protein
MMVAVPNRVVEGSVETHLLQLTMIRENGWV